MSAGAAPVRKAPLASLRQRRPTRAPGRGRLRVEGQAGRAHELPPALPALVRTQDLDCAALRPLLLAEALDGPRSEQLPLRAPRSRRRAAGASCCTTRSSSSAAAARRALRRRLHHPGLPRLRRALRTRRHLRLRLDPPAPPPPPSGRRAFSSRRAARTANPCSQAQPCRSFDRGYHVASPGQVVEAAAGSYGDQTVLYDASKEGAPANVLIRPAAGATVTVGDLNLIGHSRFVKGATHLSVQSIVLRAHHRSTAAARPSTGSSARLTQAATTSSFTTSMCAATSASSAPAATTSRS